MSSSGYYKRFADPKEKPYPRWTEDCDTLIKKVIVANTEIGYFITECRLGNKEGYLQFRPERKYKHKDGTEYLDTIPGPFHGMDIEVQPGKKYIQRSKLIANSIPEKVLLQFYCDALTEYDNRPKVNL